MANFSSAGGSSSHAAVRRAGSWPGLAMFGLGILWCAVAVAAPRHQVMPKAATDDPRFARHALVLPDGALLAYYVRPGSGASLVLVPETHGDRTQFYEPTFVDHLDPGFQLIVIESRGQGRSWPPPAAAEASIERYATDVLAVVARLALSHWYVAGHSLGGMIALEIMGRRPAGLRGAIALEGWVHSQVQRLAFPVLTPPSDAEREESRRQRAERYRSQRWSPEEVTALGKIWTEWQSGEGVVRETRYPLLSVWGDRGRSPRPARTQLLLPDSANVQLDWIAGADHYVTDPPFAGEVARAITEFMHRVDASAAAVQPEHQVVFRAPGRFGGWPANHGGWSWGDELLVGFAEGWHQKQDAARHQIDRSRPPESALARSVDGGRTWSIERPSGLLGAAAAVAALRPLATPVDFQRPGFALTLRYHEAVSYFQYSYDRGRTWHGPHALPRLDSPGWQARTDYLAHGPRELTAFVTALKRDGREGRPAALRTTDGGLTWTRRSYIGPEPAGFAIMPSTFALDDESWLATIRVKEATGSWIDAWRSVDRGGSWQPAGRAVPDAGGTSGNPPHLIRLRDGRLCLTYGYRSPPYGIRARLSADGGRTWEPEIVLRTDAAAHDLGYPRSAQRSDGRIVSVYYYNDGIHSERFIAATTWNPESALPP